MSPDATENRIAIEVAGRLQAESERDAANRARAESERKLELCEFECAALRETVAKQSKDIAHLRKKLSVMLYGRKSERDAEGQGLLAFVPELEGAVVGAPPATASDEESKGTAGEVHEAAPSAASEKRARRRGRNVIPQHLPRDRKIHDMSVEDLNRHFGEGKWKAIGEETREELDYQPGKLVVIEHVTKKYAAIDGGRAPVRAPSPKAIIPKGRPAAGLLAHIIGSKYELHLPLYRLEKLFRRQGVAIGRSTLCFWLSEVALLLDGIIRRLRAHVIARGVVRMDDTPVTLLDPNAENGSRKSFLWPFVSDDGTVVFLWTKGRGRDGPKDFLGEFRGYLQGDLASVNLSLVREGIVFVACWAHVRRRFFNARDAFPVECSRALAMIRALYAVEAEAKTTTLSPEETAHLRRSKSAPILAAIRAWGEAERKKALPSSGLGDALSYMLDHFEMLTRYVEDGRLRIDNNDVEREIRPVTVGRKNYEFFGGERGGQIAATFYTLVANCRLEGVDPVAYLQDVLSRVSSCSATEIAALTPRAWKTQPASATSPDAHPQTTAI